MASIKLAKPPYDRTSHILVIDDDDTLLKFFKIHLNKFFSKIVVVHSAKQALETLTSKTIDLVLSDIYMPGLNGLQLAKKIRKLYPSIPILFISGASLTMEEENEVRKADGYLRKPFSMEDLHHFIYSGILRRQRIQNLMTILGDSKNLIDILSGKMSPEKVLKADKLKKAKAILQELSSPEAA